MRKILIAILALAVAHTVYAQEGSAYYGLALGSFEFRESDSVGPIVDDKVGSYRLMVGYQFLDHLAVEGGYGQTRTIRGAPLFQAFNGAPITVDIGYEFKSLTVRLLGVLPFDNGVKLVGGIGYSDTKFKYNITDGVNTRSDSVSVNDPGYYVGAQYDWERFGVRLAYEKLDSDGGFFSSDVDASETTVVFFYRL